MLKSSSRNGARVIWIAVHTAEGARKAADLKAYFERPDIQASSHAIADNAVFLDALVPYDRAAWTLRNGNARSDNLELCGFANWSRAQWLDSNMGMVRHTARWIRERCQARGIPMRKLSPAQVTAGMSGVIGHVDYTNGTGDGTHWDPGPGFPWDVVMSLANETQEDDVQFSDKLKLWDGTEVQLGQLLVGLFGRIAPLYDELVEPGKSLVANSEYQASVATYVRQVDARSYKIVQDQLPELRERLAVVEAQQANVLEKLSAILDALKPPAQEGE